MDEELLSKKDEISLLMPINKIQERDDFKLIRDIPAERRKEILAQSSDSVLDVIATTVQSLCREMNLPDEETARYVQKVKERNMGYLWENNSQKSRNVDFTAFLDFFVSNLFLIQYKSS